MKSIEHYKYREITINAYWSTFDLVTKKRLDKYYYKDTFLWDLLGYSKIEIERKFPKLTRSIRETAYFAAMDYATRIFPGWQAETRYYFNTGNKDFKLAAEYIKDNNWVMASEIWEKYATNIDKEIASRACYNLAFVNEITGNLDLAVKWAQKSDKIKTKARTRNYIAILKQRKKQLQKLQKQINQ